MEEKEKIKLPQYFRIIKWSLKQGFKASKKFFIIQIITQIPLSLKSFFYAYIFARILDDAIALAASEDVALTDISSKLLIVFIFYVLVIFIQGINRNVSRKLSYSYKVHFREYEFTKLSQLGLQTIQDPDVNKLRENAGWVDLVKDLNNRILSGLSNLLLFIVSAFYLYKIIPILIPVFIIYTIVLFLEERYFYKKDFFWQVNDKHTDEKSKNFYTAYMLSKPQYIEEISVIGSFSYLANKFKKFFTYYNGGLFKLIDRQRIYSIFLNLIDTILIFGGYIQSVSLLVEGQISVGETTFYMSTIDNFDRALSNLSSDIALMNATITKLSVVYDFYNLKPMVKDGRLALPRLEKPPEIQFNDVKFSYPNSKEVIFNNFNLKINSGEKIAIVGPNGAGKSTLTKLIARLYDPQEGEILINGEDLKNLKINDWYKNMGLLFQDFKIYDPLTVEENIYIGKTAKSIDKEKIIEASKNADAYNFIQKYPKKFETFMNERYEDGIQPSKGQKQKIAIARFFYRDAPLAIFDEPTSAIDAESEYKIFNRIYDFFENKTVIIISHRFSTVRNADRIIVLDEGKIVEEGSHKELMELDGKYAKAFRLQAEGYQD